MALADELKTLQELHEKGKLTDQEFADAKAATLKKQEPDSTSRKLGRFIGLRAIPLFVLLLILLAVVWYSAGIRKTTQLIATAVRAPITLKDDVENVPASSWKAVGLDLPYSGTVDVRLQVAQGNPVDVFLVTADQLDTMKKEDWSNVKVYGNFNATKTKTYKRTGQLGQGSYYLVMRDTSLGILSSRASDISVKVQLNP
jgi:cbb3-type cytochrome oxidase subunit 3